MKAQRYREKLEANAKLYRERLLRFARSVCKDADIADDLVQQAFAEALAYDMDWEGDELISPLCQIVESRWIDWVRGKGMGGGNTLAVKAKNRVSIEECDEVARLFTPPNQHQVVELHETMHHVLALTEMEREIFRLLALEFDQGEISRRLDINRSTVGTIIGRCRALLRELTDREEPARPRRYRGVYPRHKKWRADIQGKFLGLYETAEKAAIAFDIAALAKYGDKAILNFPEMRGRLMQLAG